MTHEKSAPDTTGGTVRGVPERAPGGEHSAEASEAAGLYMEGVLSAYSSSPEISDHLSLHRSNSGPY